MAGRRAEALNLLSELEERSKRSYVPSYDVAIVYVGLGDNEGAFAWLEKAYEERCSRLIWLKAEPLFEPLRSDPRFGDLLRRIGLPP